MPRLRRARTGVSGSPQRTTARRRTSALHGHLARPSIAGLRRGESQVNYAFLRLRVLKRRGRQPRCGGRDTNQQTARPKRAKIEARARSFLGETSCCVRSSSRPLRWPPWARCRCLAAPSHGAVGTVDFMADLADFEGEGLAAFAGRALAFTATPYAAPYYGSYACYRTVRVPTLYGWRLTAKRMIAPSLPRRSTSASDARPSWSSPR